jgi:hypothetical protein
MRASVAKAAYDGSMKWILLIVLMLVVVGGTSAAATTPPALLAEFGVTHARPVAGQSFTGLTVTPLNGARISSLSCDAHLGRKTLHGHVLRYYGSEDVTALTCSWRIPAGSGGKWLRLEHATIVTSLGQSRSSSPVRWHVKT